MFFNVEELNWFFGKPPANQPIYIRGFKNFTFVDYKNFYELAIKNKKKPLQHLQVKINQKELLKNKRGDLLDSYAYREEDREKVVARA